MLQPYMCVNRLLCNLPTLRACLATCAEDSVMLDSEVVVMLQRCELYFTLGLRFLYLFIGTIFWVGVDEGHVGRAHTAGWL